MSRSGARLPFGLGGLLFVLIALAVAGGAPPLPGP